MQLTQDTQGDNHIQQYTADHLRVGDNAYTHSILVTPKVIENWPITDISALHTTHLEKLVGHQPEIVIIGTGEQQHFIPDQLLVFFAERQIGIEVMTTAAACRTFNILLAEERQVVAGLILSPPQ